MVYDTQNYCVSGLCLSSVILNTRKHNVSETGSVSQTLCFLVFRIPDDGVSPETSNSEKLNNLINKSEPH
jgi:hypothetical protein